MTHLDYLLMAAYKKKLADDWLLSLYGQVNPNDKSAGIQLGKNF